MAKNHGSQIKDDKQYEGLRKKGMSKTKAARIANTQGASHKGGRSPAYEEWSKKELYDQAKNADIGGRSQMNKGELIEALRGR